ncbi:glycosyltransferase family 4 protein [Terrimonas pollutisoli]|uniref:glycosyltransferase family 4 protein n=1 Tax=Terrimonas pollutisoli TaxID=3034147 RepID=UPI0023ECEE18|nr:glycosyltransferase family 1 protein [Terrimonas sp. H1YJ31]
MKIIIDTNLLSRKPANGYALFVYQLLRCLIKQQCDDYFILISDRPHAPEFFFDEKVRTIVAGPKINNRIQHKYWYDIKVPLLLKKYKADIFVSSAGYCSFNTRIPQCIMLPNLSFLQPSSPLKKMHLFFLKRYMRRAVEKAESIITFSNFSKAAILSNYPVEEEKLHVINGVAGDLFRCLNENEEAEIRAQYTGGKNYLIYADNVSPLKNLTNLLKAFSVFKKRQKADWKFVLASSGMDKKFMESLRSYKYRDDIITVVLEGETQLAFLLGAAYGMVFPSPCEDQYIPLLQAMSSGVPVITFPGSAFEEIAGDAALYADITSHQELAEKMMLLYKDEALRNQLIEKGKRIAAVNDQQRAVTLFWQGILKAME